MGDLGFLVSGCSPSEHAARLRELRALALVYLGPAHPATTQGVTGARGLLPLSGVVSAALPAQGPGAIIPPRSGAVPACDPMALLAPS
jgi:hypothetical protein